MVIMTSLSSISSTKEYNTLSFDIALLTGRAEVHLHTLAVQMQ